MHVPVHCVTIWWYNSFSPYVMLSFSISSSYFFREETREIRHTLNETSTNSISTLVSLDGYSTIVLCGIGVLTKSVCNCAEVVNRWNALFGRIYSISQEICTRFLLCCGYTLTDYPISIRLTSLALWQSNDCPSASKVSLMNRDKYFMWIHYERLHNHNKAKHNKTVCIFLGIYCTTVG